MSATAIHHLHNPELEQFLYSSVGVDRRGGLVTMLSTLARLNLDPWNEAAELAELGREAAGSRLALLLSHFRDVPALGHDHGSVARELAQLLPEHAERTTTLSGTLTNVPSRSWGTIVAIVTALFFLLQMLFAGAPGSGE